MNDRSTLGSVGPFSLVLENRLDRINEFWALNYAVMVEERNAIYKRFWPIAHHDRSLYVLAYDGDLLVGGARLIKPLPDGFFTHSLIARENSLPPAQALRALGNVGELTSLVLTKRVRGCLDGGACDALLRRTAREAGLSHLILNAVIPWGTYRLYSIFGYSPYAQPQLEMGLRRFDGDCLPNVVPMIVSLFDGGCLPVGAPAIRAGDIDRLADDYLRGARDGRAPV